MTGFYDGLVLISLSDNEEAIEDLHLKPISL